MMISRFVSSSAIRSQLRRGVSSSSWLMRPQVALVGTSWPTLETMVQPSAAFRSFSSSSPKSSAMTTLVDVLKREHAEEIDNGTTIMPVELKNVKASVEEQWKIVDDGALTRLFRTHGGMKIQISFHCQDTVEEDFGDFGDDEEQAPQEDEDDEAVPVRFTLTLTKAGKTMAMVCLTTPGGSVDIQSVAITAEDAASIQDNAGTVRADHYQGPEFNELAEDLQESFHNFLFDDVGLSDQVIQFIAMYCDYKEQQQYVAFLKDAQTLLS